MEAVQSEEYKGYEINIYYDEDLSLLVNGTI